MGGQQAERTIHDELYTKPDLYASPSAVHRTDGAAEDSINGFCLLHGG